MALRAAFVLVVAALTAASALGWVWEGDLGHLLVVLRGWTASW